MSELVQASQADVWYLKDIFFQQRPVKIITQNFNGPCSFIAICNILILRDQIQILPLDRATVSYEFLSQLVAEYLLTNCPDIDISAALSILPSTTKGLDLNPQFTSISAFSPAADAGELDLFSQAGIQLVHGWLVDPASPEAPVMTRIRDYDTAVTLIADADYVTKGKLLGHPDDDAPGPSSSSSASASASASTSASASVSASAPYSDQDRHKIEQALVAQHFLDATQSQLTYHGLFQLASSIQPDTLVALFRNAHLAVVYKSPDAALYALVTDDIFRHEPAVVWERLEDVDGTSSTFCDAEFRRAVPMGGDVAGWAGDAGDVDGALARQLQDEEDARAAAYQARMEERRRAAAEEAAARAQEAEQQRQGRRGMRGKMQKPKGCVLM